MRCADKSSLV